MVSTESGALGASAGGAGALRRPLLGFLGLGTAFNALMLFWFAEAVGKALGLVTWDSGVSSGSAKTQ